MSSRCTDSTCTDCLFSDLSSRLGLSAEEGERWIVELVRDARLDAKIDLQKNIVTMNKPAYVPRLLVPSTEVDRASFYSPSVHQTISDRAKQLLDRAQYVLPAPAQGGVQEQDGQQRGGGGQKRGQKPQGGQQQGIGQGATPKPVETK